MNPAAPKYLEADGWESPSSSGSDQEFPESDDEKQLCTSRCRRAALITAGIVALIAAILGKQMCRGIAQAAMASVALDLQSVDMGAINGSTALLPRTVARIAARSPVPAEVRIRDASFWARLVNGSATETVRIGSIDLPTLNIHAFQDVMLNMTSALHIENFRDFGQAGEDFIRADSTLWQVKATLDIKCWILGFIPMTFADLSLDRAITLKGMAGFQQTLNPVTMNKIESAQGLPDSLHLNVSVNLQNPSFISARIPTRMIFGIRQRNHTMGVAAADDLHLVPGLNVIRVTFTLQKTLSNEQAIQEFISGYMKAEVQLITVVGSNHSSTDPFLSMVLNGLDIGMNFKPPETKFVQGLTATVGSTGLSARTGVFNPLPQAITLGNLDLGIYLSKDPQRMIFELDSSKAETAIPGTVLQPTIGSELDIKLSPFGARLTAIFELKSLIQAAEQGNIVVNVRGPISITIQPSFQMVIQYSAQSMTAHLKWCLFCVT